MIVDVDQFMLELAVARIRSADLATEVRFGQLIPMERRSKMKWLLVAIVLNNPLKTDLTFESLEACLIAEEKMREKWAEVYNNARKQKASKDTLELVKGQMTLGTCIPSK